ASCDCPLPLTLKRRTVYSRTACEPNRASVMFRIVASISVSISLVSQNPVLGQTTADPRGTYVFESRTTRGDPFVGTVHLYGDVGNVLGYVYSTVDPPIPVTGVRWLGQDTLGVRFSLGPTVVTQIFALDGDRFTGHYSYTRDGQSHETPLTGERMPRTDHPDLTPTPCDFRGVPFEVRCAMLHVPEDPDRPDGRMIPLRIVILPAEAEDPEPDAMFTFAGGPGQAATEVAGAYAQTMAGVRRTRDIVIVDQRGTGASNPLTCEFENPQDRTELLFTWRFPPASLERCSAALTERADLRLYHTWIAAADIERVREWLGYPAINLYGGSYGTRMAQTYLKRFPDRVRTATLRGVAAPGGMLPLENPGDGQASLELVFDECRSEPGCAKAFSDLTRDLNTAMRTLEETAATVRVIDPVTRDSVNITITHQVLAGALRRLLMSGDAIPAVPLVINRAAQGDYSLLLPGITATLGISRSLYIGMSLSVGCPEDAPPLAGANIDSATAGTFMGGGPARGFLDACSRWPQADVPAEFYEPVTAAVPVLLLSGRYDPATPVRWARRVADALPNSLHIVMPGVSHSPFPQCAQGIMTQFVELGGMVGVDADCVSELRRNVFRVGG
ncbi:MAG: alpha/beta fold hydrolase, partial [Gemmatimonadota bacterium]